MSLSSAEVRDLKPSEKNKYNNFEKLTLPHGEEDGYGFKPKSKYSVMILKGLCKGSDKEKSLAYNFDKYQFNATAICYHKGTGYRNHLRSHIDKFALEHCKKYEKDALFVGKAKIETQLSSRLRKGIINWLSVGTAIPYKHVSVAYYCSIEKNPAYAPVIKKDPPKIIKDPIKPLSKDQKNLLPFVLIALLGFAIVIFIRTKSENEIKKSEVNISKQKKEIKPIKDRINNYEKYQKLKESESRSNIEESTSSKPDLVIKKINPQIEKLKIMNKEGILTDEELIKALKKIK